MKPEVLNITTPVCLFQFAWLVEPDTKFDASGIWQVECLIHPDDATEVEEQLSGLLERWKAQLKSANPNKKFKLASLPWEFTEVDGKPYFKVKTKMKGGGVRADGTQWKQRPPVLFNADGSPMTEEQKEKVNKCGPGTTGQVNGSGWETAAFGVGIKIQPETVIIHNHVNTSKPHKAMALKQKKQPSKKKNLKRKQGLKQSEQTNFRSKFEAAIAATFEANKVPFAYETLDVSYQISCIYKPDFILDNGICIETKGFFSKGPQKTSCIKTQNPTLEVRFCFQNSKAKLSRGKRSLTYGAWATKHGFLWSHGSIPEEWYGNQK